MATNPKDVPQHYYSLEEYFALEDASDARFEYWEGDIVCMSAVGCALKLRDIYDGVAFAP
ncbi:MAG TPA: hypothetical protein VF588_16285 [Pyrinomonadaceae bacterium]